MKYKNVQIFDELPPDRPRLPEEIKTEWVAALRSGDYEQLHCKLSDGVRYCCLGVLSKLQSRLTFLEYRWCDLASSIHSALSSNNPLHEVLYNSGKLAVEVHLTVGDLVMVCSSLVQLNDSGATFDEIAWVIDNVF